MKLASIRLFVLFRGLSSRIQRVAHCRALTVALLVVSVVPATWSQEPTTSSTTQTETQAPDLVKPAPFPLARVAEGSGDVRVDGVLDESIWQDATRIEKFWEWFPGNNVKPTVDTEVLLAYDDRFIYLGARAFDPEPEKIRAHLMDRDDIDTLIEDDYILLMLDPFNDQRRSFHFRVNPLGVQADALNGWVVGFEDWSWDLIWQSAGRLTDEGYVVEMAIPLNQLPFPSTSEAQTWRVNVGRSRPRSQRHRMQSSPQDNESSCIPCQHLEMTGIEGLKPGQSIELTPTLTAGRTDRRSPFPQGSVQSGDEDYELGLSGRWNITPSIRLSFAANPDFSQVEADEGQLNVNERFALFFDEQRPFFLEGVDVFSTPIQAVFTRTVSNPDWGLKLTGKQGKNSFGVFVSQDDVNNLVLPSNQGSAFVSSADGLLDNEVLGTVVRYRRDVGENSSLGVLYAGRDGGDDYFNRVAGVDGSIRLGQADEISFQWLHSETEYPGAVREAFSLTDEQLDGEGLRLAYNHFERNWFWRLGYDRLDKDFRADSGFVPRVDLERASGLLQRTWWFEQDAKLTNASLAVNLSQSDDRDGLLSDRKLGVSSTLNGPLQSQLFVQTWNIDKRSPRGTLFEDLRGGEVDVSFKPSGSLSLALYAALEDEVDFANDREAKLLMVSPRAGFKLGKNINGRVSHFRRSFELDGETYIQADLTELRVYYHFSTRSFVRAIVQRTDLKNDPDFFTSDVERESENVFAQLLFSYKLNAQTVFFAGYSDNRLGGDIFSLTQADRTFFIKIGYAWLL